MENHHHPKSAMIQMKPDLFICGLIGSGKDTIVNHLQLNFNYWKLRNAGTIKQVIQDVKGFDYIRLENEKRNRPEIREMHHDVDKMLTSMEPYVQPIIKSNNRLRLLVNRKSMEFENPIKHFIISDIRSYSEIRIAFANNPKLIGIFLLRTSSTKEYINKQHWTNSLNYNDEHLIDLLNYFSERCIVINNQGEKNKWQKFTSMYKGPIHTPPDFDTNQDEYFKFITDKLNLNN